MSVALFSLNSYMLVQNKARIFLKQRLLTENLPIYLFPSSAHCSHLIFQDQGECIFWTEMRLRGNEPIETIFMEALMILKSSPNPGLKAIYSTSEAQIYPDI